MRISGWGSDVCSPALGALASVTTLIAHKSGGYITAVASCVPAKTDAQGIGSATTYLRRYSAAAAAGIAQEDDDGNAAAHNGKPKAVSNADQAKAESFREAIEAATDDIELGKIGKEISGSYSRRISAADVFLTSTLEQIRDG